MSASGLRPRLLRVALVVAAVSVATAMNGGQVNGVRAPAAAAMRDGRRRLEALPGFNVGTAARGMDIVRNGVVNTWQTWDALQTWAQSGVSSNEFVVWFEPRDEPPPGLNQTFSISAASVKNDSSQPNEANCTVTTTPSVGTSMVAGNFTTTFEAAYACAGVGQVEVELTLAIPGYNSVTILFFKTNGNALDVGLAPNASDVVALGKTAPPFVVANPQHVVPYEERGTTLYLRLGPGQLPHTHTEPRTSDFVITTSQKQVVDVALSGPASVTTVLGQDTLVLQVNYTCKAQKDLTSSNIQLSWAMTPFAPIAFAWVKDCNQIVGLDIVQVAGAHVTPRDVVKDGILLPGWKDAHWFSALVTALTFQLTSTKQTVTLKPVQDVAVTSVCPVTMGGTALAGGSVASTPLELTLTYACNGTAQGVQNNTIHLDFGSFGTVSIEVTKFVGHRPAFDLVLQSPNVTADPLTDLHVVRDGLAVGNWSTANAFPYLLPPGVGVVRGVMSVATGMPFVLGAAFSVSSPTSHSGQCDPHIRPAPNADGQFYRIDAEPRPLEITFWCKTNTLGDNPTFTATFPDNEYFTTTFAFRKATNIVQSFAITTDNGTQVMMGGVALGGWDSTGSAHVAVAAGPDSTATSAFVVDNLDHDITAIEVLPFMYSSSVGLGECSPVAQLDSMGSKLTIDYNCTFAPLPAAGSSADLGVDIIVVFHVTDPAYPDEQFSPPLMHWGATVTYTAPPAAPSDVLTVILACAGGVVVIIIVVVLVMRLARPRDRSNSFQATASRPLRDPVATSVGVPGASPSQAAPPLAFTQATGSRPLRDPLAASVSVPRASPSQPTQSSNARDCSAPPTVPSAGQQHAEQREPIDLSEEFAQQFDALGLGEDSDDS